MLDILVFFKQTYIAQLKTNPKVIFSNNDFTKLIFFKEHQLKTIFLEREAAVIFKQTGLRHHAQLQKAQMGKKTKTQGIRLPKS